MAEVKVHQASKEERLSGYKKTLAGLKKNLIGVYVGDDYVPNKLGQLEDIIKNYETLQ